MEKSKDLMTLDLLEKGEKAKIIGIDESRVMDKNSLPFGELERRLLEMGFIEGTSVTRLHEGPFGKDPISVLIRTCFTVALRRSEARAILVQKDVLT